MKSKQAIKTSQKSITSTTEPCQASHSFLASMEKLLWLLQMPVSLRCHQHAEILQLGPLQAPGLPAYNLGICFRHPIRRALGLKATCQEFLDFHIRVPYQLDPSHHSQAFLRLLALNHSLPLGAYQLSPTGRLMFVYALPLQHPELPVATFFDCIHLLRVSFEASAPQLLASIQPDLPAQE
ncbi:MAG: hypothetical protein CVV27_03670 [Candidatus Melainabacteria bacterium HGW-Melainabacteria-1]|nr:MAG: hypothetical protein CVV27_03670 [Candidatus Melainabacteria bacterium HGW-Melainabacteria-1]